jgi:hypothetical protein
MLNPQSNGGRSPAWWSARALLLVVLVVARIRIDTLAEAAVLPMRQQDVRGIPSSAPS